MIAQELSLTTFHNVGRLHDDVVPPPLSKPVNRINGYRLFMDPITAFSLATNVITIIQTGIKTALEVRDVHRSETGARERNNVLEQTTANLDSKCDQLLKCLSAGSDGQCLSPAELELRDIAFKCTKSAKKLNDLLG